MSDVIVVIALIISIVALLSQYSKTKTGYRELMRDLKTLLVRRKK